MCLAHAEGGRTAGAEHVWDVGSEKKPKTTTERSRGSKRAAEGEWELRPEKVPKVDSKVAGKRRAQAALRVERERHEHRQQQRQ